MLDLHAIGIAALRHVNIDSYTAMKKELVLFRDLVGKETFNLACYLLDKPEFNKILLAITPDNTSTMESIILRLIKMGDSNRSFIIDNLPLVIAAIENGISLDEIITIKQQETLRRYLVNYSQLKQRASGPKRL